MFINTKHLYLQPQVLPANKKHTFALIIQQNTMNQKSVARLILDTGR